MRRALLVGFAVTVPVVFGIALDHLDIGLAICFGAFWSSPSNTPRSLHHKKIGILFSAALVTLISFIGGYLDFAVWGIVPVLGVLTFLIAYISIYGFRASLISFSGLLALVLSFAHTPSNLAPYQYSLLIGLGGLWYLLLVIIAYKFNPKAQAKESLSETFLLTARFLKIRSKLIGGNPDRESLQTKLFSLQTELIENHEKLRDILINTRKRSGYSNYQNRQLLIFIQLVEMLETAVANPIQYEKMDSVFKNNPHFQDSFKDIVLEISIQLRKLAANQFCGKGEKLSNLEEKLSILKDEIEQLQSSNLITNEAIVSLQHYFQYQQKQLEKLRQIYWLIDKPVLKDKDLLSIDVLKKFLAQQDYDPKLWLRNFSFKSTIFKHSLRLSLTVMIGYAVGNYFAFQNPYWILLTIIVIMRPNYGLTKSRAKDRLIGTVVGAIIAACLLLLIKNAYVQGAIGIVAIIIAFSVVQKNYKISATFVTISIVFIYAILRPDILVVIQYRILDTIIGAALSFMAILWLWPAWGFLEIRQNIKSSLEANTSFFSNITKYYIEKGLMPTNLKVARKKAFLETSNLNAAFQKIVQEPKSKQVKKDVIYEFVALNHTMLSSLASLSTFLQHNKTTPASSQFKSATQIIETKLSHLLHILQVEKQAEYLKILNEEEKQKKVSILNQESEEFDGILKSLPSKIMVDNEAHLIWEQLSWLHSLVNQMALIVKKIPS